VRGSVSRPVFPDFRSAGQISSVLIFVERFSAAASTS
jgi:hypothetical protein